MNGLTVSFAFLAVFIAAAQSASLGNGLLTIYPEPVEAIPEEAEVLRARREAEARGHLLSHLHSHHGGGGGQYYSKPVSCYECSQTNHGSSHGAQATFAQSSAGTISTDGDHGSHGGIGSQSSSQSASYNFGPFSASFSSSQSTGNGGFGGFF